MKKIFMSMMAVAMIAIAAGMSSCSEKVESQIFDLGYVVGNLGSGTATAFELYYKPIFIDEISKVAPEVADCTFMLNSSEKKAKADVKVAFDAAVAKAQEQAGQKSIIEGVKVHLKYSNATNHNPVDFLEYTFK